MAQGSGVLRSSMGLARSRLGVRRLETAGAWHTPNVHAVTRNVSFSKLQSVPMPEDDDPSSVISSLPPETPITQSYVPSTPFLAQWSTVSPKCHVDGQPVTWPWEGESRGGYLGGGIQPTRRAHHLDDNINKFLDLASADGRRGRKHTGVKAWFSFCEDVMGTPGDRPMDPNSPLWARLEEEWLGMRFVCALVEDRGISPQSAATYFSAVQGWHAREHGIKLAGGLKLERLPQMLKGLRRAMGDTPRAIRRGIAPQALKKAMDLLLDPSNASHANVRAALATALQGLLRSQEFAVSSGSQRGDTSVPMRADLVELNQRRMVIMIDPCKNMRQLSGKTSPLVIGAGGEHVDAVWEVQNLLRVDQVAPEHAHRTPLFRDPATGRALSYDQIMSWTRSLMAAVGEDPTQFGTHSYRIGGATALFAAGANETVIRTMGRWSSDIHRLYVRACFEDCCEWTRRAGSQQVSDVAGVFDEVDYY